MIEQIDDKYFLNFDGEGDEFVTHAYAIDSLIIQFSHKLREIINRVNEISADIENKQFDILIENLQSQIETLQLLMRSKP